MNRLQKWFEHIAGVTQEERERRAFAQALFGSRPMDMGELQLPACWRRKARQVRGRR